MIVRDANGRLQHQAHAPYDKVGYPPTLPPSAHTHTASQITDFSEAVDDRVGALIVDGVAIDWTYNDGANVLTGDFAINTLTAETSLASGDLLAFLDVSVGSTPTATRKVTLANLAAYLGTGVIDHGALTGLGDDDHAQYVLRAGRPGTANDVILRTTLSPDAGTIYGNSQSTGGLELNGNSALDGTGFIQINGQVVISTDGGSVQPSLDIQEAINGYSNRFIPSASQVGDIAYILPVDFPAVSGYVLSATDTGVMSWVAGSGGGGAMDVAEDGSDVVATASTINFVEPDLVLVTDAGGGQADVAMDSYLPYVGRPGAISAILSTDNDGTLYGNGGADPTKFLYLANSNDIAPTIAIGQAPGGQASMAIGAPVAASFLPFSVFGDNDLGQAATLGFFLLNGGIGASPIIFGVGAPGSALGAFSPTGDFDNLLKINGISADADSNLTFGASPVSLVFAQDGPGGSGFAPGQFVIVLTDRTGFTYNPWWLKQDGRIGYGIDVGYPEGQSHLQNPDPAVVASIIQGSPTQTADLSNWDRRIAGIIFNDMMNPLPVLGATSIFLVDSTDFAPSGTLWLYHYDDDIGSDFPIEYSANNTGTGELTLVDPLPKDIPDERVYQTRVGLAVAADFAINGGFDEDDNLTPVVIQNMAGRTIVGGTSNTPFVNVGGSGAWEVSGISGLFLLGTGPASGPSITATGVVNFAGIVNNAELAIAGASPTVTSAYSFLANHTWNADPTATGTVTITNAGGYRAHSNLANNGEAITIVNYDNFWAEEIFPSTNATIENAHGFRMTETPGAGVIELLHGVKIEDQTAPTVGATGIETQIAPGTGRFAFVDSGGAPSTLVGKFTKYNNVTTAGFGLGTIVAAARSTAQTAAVGSVATFTPATDGTFLVSANVLVTTATVHNFNVQVDYTDEGNTARTLNLTFTTVAGTLGIGILNAGGAVPYAGLPAHIRAKASTAITVKTSGTFTTVTYNVDAQIMQIS